MGGTAAVIVEPVGPESGTRPVPFGFNAAVRELCDEFGALLIFDEVVTGFRLGLGGAQGYYGVRPDLTIFGKCITGGYPMAGGVGGRRDVMASFASGIGGKSGERAYVGGTLSANPLSCAAGYFAISEMERTGAPVLAGMAGDRLTAGLNRIIDKYGLPFVAYNQGSIVHLETSGVMLLDLKHPVRFAKQMKPRKHMMEEMGAAYAANGLITLAGSRMYTSMADTDEVIDDALERFERVLSQRRRGLRPTPRHDGGALNQRLRHQGAPATAGQHARRGSHERLAHLRVRRSARHLRCAVLGGGRPAVHAAVPITSVRWRRETDPPTERTSGGAPPAAATAASSLPALLAQTRRAPTSSSPAMSVRAGGSGCAGWLSPARSVDPAARRREPASRGGLVRLALRRLGGGRRRVLARHDRRRARRGRT